MEDRTIDVQSENRTGITYEILSIFAGMEIDLIGVEMITNHTFIKYKEDSRKELYWQLISELKEIDGVDKVTPIELLPSEEKNLHLNAILSQLPDPIIDVDEFGQVVKVNNAALAYLEMDEDEVYQLNITELLNRPLDQLISHAGTNLEVTINHASFFAEVTPIYHRHGSKSRGAIVTLKPSEELGLAIASMQENHYKIGEAIVASTPMKEVFNAAKKFSQLDLPVLICGETGTGKELVAKYIHENSVRRDKPFLALNCAALPENLLESELFGYDAGSFSGALKKGKPGLLELANKGTLFLDEVGEMSVYLQAKLLRFLQDYTFRRVGGQEEKSVNVRVISATHRTLSENGDSSDFRHDLFYRLNVLSLNIPSLRDRQDDIKPLAKHFANNAGIQIRNKPSKLTGPAYKELLRYQWPGNVRQLQNFIFRSAAMATSNIIGPDDLRFNESNVVSETPDNTKKKVSSLKQALKDYENELLLSMYPDYPSTRLLAQRLKVSHNTIAIKLRKLKRKKDQL